MDDLLSEFLTETLESLERLDAEIVRLERQPNDPDLLAGIFRLVHTIKGTCGFLGLHRLEAMAHASENVLGDFRDGIQEVTPGAVSQILQALDHIKSLLAALQETGTEPDGDDSALLGGLAALHRAARGAAGGRSPRAKAPSGKPKRARSRVAAAPTTSTQAKTGATASSLHERMGGAGTIDAAVEICLGRLRGDAEFAPLLGAADADVVQGRLVELAVWLLGGPVEYRGPDPARVLAALAERGLTAAHIDHGLTLLRQAFASLEVAAPDVDAAMSRLGAARRDLVAASIAARPIPALHPTETASQPVVIQPAIRVTVDTVENLMTTVSELVLTRNQLLRLARRYDDAELRAPLQRLSHVTGELRELAMKTRLQPIGSAWAKLPRIVRDLAIELGKEIVLDMHGAETELDRQVLDMIKDPLTHMVRNSADHGIETPDERRRAGKDATGRIVLDARYEAGHVIIEVRDDGRGIDVAKIRRRAAAAGLAAESELAAMAEHRLQQFIFRPGFSTADEVTAVSGRGVGMDVVRANVERIGGHIEITSVPGSGSTFAITIPLTLAIVPALIVECAGERFAIPQPSIVELVRVSKASGHRIETISRTPVLRLRDRLLPLISLAALLRLDPPAGDGGETAGWANGSPFVVVVQIGPTRFGLVVDRIHDTEEIVVKPVAPMLRQIGAYSGATVLGDGSVVMVLDPHGLVEEMGRPTITDQNVPAAEGAAAARRADRTALLVFRCGSPEPKAVPLALVARLETFEASAIETSSGIPVVQYRDRLMPLVSIDPRSAVEPDGRRSVIVLGDDETNVGLVVDEIVDIVEDHFDVQPGAVRAGVLGSAIVAGRATEIIDVAAYFEHVHRNVPAGLERGPNAETGGRKRLLLVENSPFFMNLLIPILTLAGYAVSGVQVPREALDLRDRGETFDVIVSDVDLPGMSGFEFARAVRAGGPWKDVPLIALASRVAPSDLAKGREAGFVDYVAKLDRAALLDSLSQSGELWRGAA